MDQLPRELQLKIMSKMDIDTRIPCKLRVSFKNVLEQIQKQLSYYSDDFVTFRLIGF